MADIINLNRARKARDKAEARSAAAANRAAFGRPRGDKDRAQAERDHLDQVLDGARRDRPDDDQA